MPEKEYAEESVDTSVMVPQESAAPEEGELPDRYGKIVNLAGDSELCEKVRQCASTAVRRFANQEARQEFTKTGGMMDIADRMYRVALNRDTNSDQTKDTLSNVTSPMFHIQVRTVSAGEMVILFGDPGEDLPARYEPEINTTEYTRQDGVLIAEQQNMLAKFTFDEDKRRDKIRELDLWHNKYGLQVVSCEWVRETRDVIQNVPDEKAGKLDNGQWRKFKREKKNRVVRDWPVLMVHPIENCYFDAQIPEAENQRVFAVKQRKGIEELYSQQADGYLKNVGKLTASALFTGDALDPNKPIEDRMTNAGEEETQQSTGEFEVWQCWVRVPIKEWTTKGGKQRAKYDSGVAPQLYWAIFAGDIHKGDAVCLKLCKNPHWHGKIPYHFIRSHRDDKGAYSLGYATMIQSLYWQAVTNLNQSIDNVTERNWAPMISDGPVHTRDLTFRANKLIRTDRLVKFERMNIPDTTQITMQMHNIVESMANKLTGADKPIQAEALGQRTSATEAKNIYDQALQPLDEKAEYFASQLFPWLYELDMEYWRQYGDPEQIITVTHNNMQYEVKPTEMYGPLKTKVTAVNRFRNNTVRRMELNSLIQNVAPIFVPVMEKEGTKELGRQLFTAFGFENIDKLFPPGGDYDAKANAQAAVESMIVQGEWVEPQPQQNHSAWLQVLEPALAQYGLLGEIPQENLTLLKAHIEMRKQMMNQQSAPAQNPLQAGGGQQMPAEETQGMQGLTGEATGNPIEAQMGAQVNG